MPANYLVGLTYPFHKTTYLVHHDHFTSIFHEKPSPSAYVDVHCLYWNKIFPLLIRYQQYFELLCLGLENMFPACWHTWIMDNSAGGVLNISDVIHVFGWTILSPLIKIKKLPSSQRYATLLLSIRKHIFLGVIQFWLSLVGSKVVRVLGLVWMYEKVKGFHHVVHLMLTCTGIVVIYVGFNKNEAIYKMPWGFGKEHASLNA